MSTKYIAIAAALAACCATMDKLNNTYGALNSQDADFKNLKVQVDSALALPEDPTAGELAPTFTVMSQQQVDDFIRSVVYQMPPAVDAAAIAQAVTEALPPPTDAAAIIAAVAGHIENSDVEVLAAIAATRTDILTAVTPA